MQLKSEMEEKPIRSPRESTPTPITSNPSNTTTESDKDRNAFALSLYVEPLPVPLKVCYPDSDFPAQITTLRRSSRFTSNKYRTASPALPRAGSKTTPAVETVGMSMELPNKRRRIDGDWKERVFRRSPRFSQSESKLLALPESNLKRESKPQREQVEKSDLEECLRSPKVEPLSIALPDITYDSPKTTSKKEALTGDREAEQTISSERRASITSDLVHTDDGIPPASSQLSDSAEECELEKGNSDTISESVKCLRSRKIQFPVVSEPNAAKTPTFSNGCVVDSKDSTVKGNQSCTPTKRKEKNKSTGVCFIGEPIPTEEAQERWRWRYDLKVVIIFIYITYLME